VTPRDGWNKLSSGGEAKVCNKDIFGQSDPTKNAGTIRPRPEKDRARGGRARLGYNPRERGEGQVIRGVTNSSDHVRRERQRKYHALKLWRVW